MRTWWILAGLALGAAGGCTNDEAAPPAAPPVARPGPKHAVQLPHSKDPRIAACAAALETGDLSKVQELLLALGDAEAPDSVCLRARLLASNGDAVGAVRAIEQALETWPGQGALYATAAEIHAAGGRLQSAQDEIRAGLSQAGKTPDLDRAFGVLLLMQPGRAKEGLAKLLEATRADPDLLFCRGPLAEAHRLLAMEALGKQQGPAALVHAREGLALEPDHAELRLLEADALAATRNFDEALPAYEALAKSGVELGASLRMYYQKGATQALLEQRPEVAFERYLRARQLGATREELGHGAEILQRAIDEARKAGDEAYEQGRYADARAKLQRVLDIEPADVAARNQLGVVCFKLEDFAAACEAWEKVLAAAEEQELKLPDPVHLNLSRALYAAGRKGEIAALLEGYLRREPEGAWAVETREMLARLER